MEGLTLAVLLIIIGGIYYPIQAASFGLVQILGRALYGVMYSLNGPKGRIIGVLMTNIALIGTLVLTIMSCVDMIKSTPLPW